MKLILNNKDNEAIYFTSFERSLNIDDPAVKYELYINSDNVGSSASLDYFAQYINTPITSYTIYTDNNDIVVQQDSLENVIIKFLNESIAQDYYRAQVILQILEPKN